jgi:hypothetical protein
MRSTFFTLAASFTFAGLSVALPREHDAGFYNFLSKRMISPDNSCGVVMGQTGGYSCDAAANEGGCCSQYGYCGNTSCKLLFAFLLFDIHHFHEKSVAAVTKHRGIATTLTSRFQGLLMFHFASLLWRWVPVCLWNL